MQQFGNRIGQATGADVMEPADRIVRTHGHAAVDHFLAAPLHFRVIALHAGEIQVFGGIARCHRAGSAAAQADQHRRAAQHDDRIARLQAYFLDLHAVDGAQSTGEHDRLVVGAGQRRGLGKLETAEVADQIRAAEFVVEGRCPQGAIQHDFQGRRHARIQRTGSLPFLRQGRNPQMRDAETAQSRLGLAAATGGPFVADLAACAGAGAGKRRDGGGVIMGFHLDAERRIGFRLAAIGSIRSRAETRRRITFHHRGVVAVGGQCVLRRVRMGVLDHAEQGLRLVFAFDGPGRVEYLVAAVLGIGLREHHQFDIRGVATQLAVTQAQVVDLVLGQGQAQTLVGRFQRTQRNAFQGAARRRGEQRGGLFARRQQGLGHRIMQQLRQGGGVLPALQVDAGTALHALDRQACAAQQFGGLAGPGRQGAQTRHDETGLGVRSGGDRIGRRLQDAAQYVDIHVSARFGFDEIDVPRAAYQHGRRD